MDAIQTAIKERGLPPLLKREFVKVTELKEDDLTIRVMQWNLLAQALTLGEENFMKCPPEALKWEDRKLRILEEILRFKPTVLCLEEVDMFTYYQEELSKHGYLGIFNPKPSSPCLQVEDNNGPDGCALFYDTSKVTCMKSNSIILKLENGDLTNQVSIMCHFQTKSENLKDFMVACTHLKAKTGFENSRRQQTKYLTEYVEKNYQDCPIIICGDFNGPPDEPLYEVMKSSDLNLTSSYTSLSPEGKEPKYTTWKIRPKGEVCHTIDYIWYTKKGLRLTSVLNIASDEEIGENRLPSLNYPSDHISIVSDFVIE